MTHAEALKVLINEAAKSVTGVGVGMREELTRERRQKVSEAVGNSTRCERRAPMPGPNNEAEQCPCEAVGPEHCPVHGPIGGIPHEETVAAFEEKIKEMEAGYDAGVAGGDTVAYVYVKDGRVVDVEKVGPTPPDGRYALTADGHREEYHRPNPMYDDSGGWFPTESERTTTDGGREPTAWRVETAMGGRGVYLNRAEAERIQRHLGGRITPLYTRQGGDDG